MTPAPMMTTFSGCMIIQSKRKDDERNGSDYKPDSGNPL